MIVSGSRPRSGDPDFLRRIELCALPACATTLTICYVSADAFGGNIVEMNLVYNTVRETNDHGVRAKA
jgi:hypothetical protein